jgi:DMSO reductase anchor subunit
VRLQILATEHWSLLATRSMTWNEIFTRAGMFLTTLSAAVVALALVAQATDFDDNFRVFALVGLPAVLVLGIGTLIRLGDAMTEDVWLVFGMNRLRHAYLEVAPELEPYFVTSQHDDFPGAIHTYGPDAGPRPSRILSATPTVVAVIDAMLVGVIVALLITLATDSRPVYVFVGVAGAVVTIAILVGVLPYRQISRMRREWKPAFPTES